MVSLNTPETRKRKLVEDWTGITNWEDRYKKLIELGKAMPSMPEELKTEDNKVRGCQSQVWIKTEKKADGLVYFQGDSDALLVRGLVALVTGIYSGSKAEDILKTPPDFVKALGFETHLSPSRTNGLYSMIKRIMMDAFVLKGS
jgi:cysteine desulfuration protein SufE